MQELDCEGAFRRARVSGRVEYVLFDLSTRGLERFHNAGYSADITSGTVDFAQYSLLPENLAQLSEIIAAVGAPGPPVEVSIGGDRIFFAASSETGLGARFGPDGAVHIEADAETLRQLAEALLALAEVPAEAGHLGHIHLDLYFSRPPRGLSDIVFQRLDELNEGAAITPSPDRRPSR